MNSRAYQFQLQAAEAAAPVVHAAEGGEQEVNPKAPLPLLIKIQAAQDTAAYETAAPRQGSGGLAPTTMGPIGIAAEATRCKCPECPKWFASEKAMFGHLRKHPERGYKGATRPTTATASAAATTAAAAGDKKPSKKVPRKDPAAGAVPATNVAGAAAAATKAWAAEADLSTKQWPAAAKRGRTPVEAVPQASGSSEEEEAAMILLELASSSRTSSEVQQPRPSVEPVRGPDAGAVTGHQIQAAVVEEPMLLDLPAGHQTPEAAEQQIVQSEDAMELSAESSQTPAVNKQVTDLVITTEAVLIVVPANKPVIFPSLDSAGAGGDKKAAKKQRRATNPEQTAASSPPPPLPEGGAAVVRTPLARRMPSPASDKKHTCPTCGKSFPTHQALGGHMSYHVKGAKSTSARLDGLAAAQAMQNILAHRDQQSSGTGTGTGTGNGNVNIPASAGAGAGALQERQEAQPPPAQSKALTPPAKAKAKAPTPTPQAATLHVGADALQERQVAQPAPAQAKAPTPPAKLKTTTPTPQAPAPHVDAGASQERQEAQPPPAQAQAKAVAPHVCDACHLVFPSGQALGGHKRKHWVPEKQQAKAAAPAPAPVPALPAPAPAPAPRDFDLNEMPMEEQGENNNPP